MNFAPFAVATTNIFPCANSTAGAQLLSEFNLRARESVATSEEVKYMIGPSYVHSEDDFSVSLLKDDLGNPLGSNTVFVINEGKGVINGHFIQSLVPIQIDLAVANQYLLEHGKQQLSGKLKVGLRVMYSTEATMAGAMLKENEKYYEGVHVVVLPPDQFFLPTDKPGIDQQQYVTAHLWLADISFVNGRLSEVIKQNAHKVEMIPASRISDIDGMLSGEFLKEPRVNAGKLYVYSGKVTESTSEGDISKAGWCEAQQSLMIWDAEPSKMQKADYQAFEQSFQGKKVEATFGTNSDDEVVLIVPHKQVDGITRTSGAVEYYAPKTYKLPVADFAMGTPGTVNKAYTNHIKAISTDIRNIYSSLKGKQRAYIEVLDDVSKLPEINPEWNIGDYILVGQDNTLLVDGESSRAPSVLYMVVPGYVEKYEAYTGDALTGARLDYKEFDAGTDQSVLTTEIDTLFDLGSEKDGWTYRGVEGEDYFKATIPAEIPTIDTEYSEDIVQHWYRTHKITQAGNSVTIDTDGYYYKTAEESSNISAEDEAAARKNGSLHIFLNGEKRNRCAVGAGINFPTIQYSEKKTVKVSFYVRGYAPENASNSLSVYLLNNGTQLDPSATPISTAISNDDWTNSAVTASFTVNAEQPVNGLQFVLGEYEDVAAINNWTNLYIDNVTVTVGTAKQDLLAGTGSFINRAEASQIYVVTETGKRSYSSAMWLTGAVPLATESAIGGFYNVPDSYADAGYVRLNENGHLVVNDYALLRSGVLAYQLGEDFDTSAGAGATAIQEELNQYVNQRVAFPNANHIQNAENVNVIHVTLDLVEEDTANTINIYDIDSRFNTCVYVHLRGTASNTLTVNISDVAKLRLEIADEVSCTVNIARCNLYYDADILDRLTYISDMDIWYERFSDSDEWLQVTGRTITQISGPVGWVSEDQYNGEDTSLEDIHYAYALRALTFSSSGNIIGVDMAIKNELSHIGEDSNEYLHVSNFRIPQASGFTYPESRLNNKIKISGRFVSVPAVNDTASGVSIVETDFVAVTNTYSDSVLDNGINGTITFLTKVHTIENVAGLSAAQELTGWASGDYHVFHGEVAYESNT